jgi:FkbM family methyltransferase
VFFSLFRDLDYLLWQIPTMMKILVVHNRYRQPGGEDVVFEQERELLERVGNQVVIYSRTNLEMDALSSGPQRLILVKNMVSSSETHREFSKLLAEEKPDVVHIHNTFVMVSPSIYSACVEQGVPVVQTLHNYRLLCPAATLFRDGHPCEECREHGLWRAARHGCYRDSRLAAATVAVMLSVHRQRHTWDRKVDAYIALSEFARSKFVEGGLPAEKIFVKPNFVSPDPGVGPATREYAVFAGRLSAEKGVTTLLAAWDRLKNPIPLMILGDGPDRKELEAQVTPRCVNAVSFLGHLKREETLAMMQKARVVIVPSECYENFPLIIAEAFACGTPVVCSRLGAMQEVVEDGRTGIHFTAGNADDLAGKLEWAWTHSDHLRTMGWEARAEYEMKYTAEVNYKMLSQIYQRMLRTPRPSQSASPVLPRKSLVVAKRARDISSKAWGYLATALQHPTQLLRLPSLCAKGVHIGEFLKLNNSWLKSAGIKTVIDVGAHSGEFSSAVRAVLSDARVYAFEPLPDCCQKLRTKLGNNNGSVHVFEVALGDQHGPVQFWRSDQAKSSSLLRMSELHQAAFPWTAGNHLTEVQLRRLDEYSDQMDLSSRTLLKIDVQGYEDRVLRGAKQVLKQVDYVLVEVSVAPLYEEQAQFDPIYSFLLQSGFSYVGNLEQMLSPLDGSILQLDALFIKNGISVKHGARSKCEDSVCL